MNTLGTSASRPPGRAGGSGSMAVSTLTPGGRPSRSPGRAGESGRAAVRNSALAVALAALAFALQGCGLFGGGTPPCEKPQEYLDAEAAAALVAPEGLKAPQAFGNLEIPEGEVLEGQARRSNGSCLEEPPLIQQPGAG